MFLNVPPAEVFHFFNDRPLPLLKCRDLLDKEFVQRCEELLQQQLLSKGSLSPKRDVKVNLLVIFSKELTIVVMVYKSFG